MLLRSTTTTTISHHHHHHHHNHQQQKWNDGCCGLLSDAESLDYLDFNSSGALLTNPFWNVNSPCEKAFYTTKAGPVRAGPRRELNGSYPVAGVATHRLVYFTKPSAKINKKRRRRSKQLGGSRQVN